MVCLFDWLYEKLSRVTSGGKLIKEIDGLRFIAITCVVFCHVNNDMVKTLSGTYHVASGNNEFWNWLFQNGSIGVHLFFVISGFVLALPFAKHYLCKGSKPNIGRYFLRRVTRLEPPFMLNLILLAALSIFVMHKPISEVLPHLLASMGYVHNIAYQSMSTINAVTWSLEIEVQFYILAPLIAFVYVIRPKIVRRLTIVGVAAAFVVLRSPS